MPILHKKSWIVSSGGVQAVAAQPGFEQGANPDQIRRIIGPREFPVQRKKQ